MRIYFKATFSHSEVYFIPEQHPWPACRRILQGTESIDLVLYFHFQLNCSSCSVRCCHYSIQCPNLEIVAKTPVLSYRRLYMCNHVTYAFCRQNEDDNNNSVEFLVFNMLSQQLYRSQLQREHK
jgi:hypothetical protein